MLRAVIGWYRNSSTHTPAYNDHQRLLDDFLERKHHFHVHAWQLLGEMEALRMHAEILFVLEDIMFQRTVNETDLFKLLGDTIAQARKSGRAKLDKQRAEYLAKCLLGGAGKAHKMANSDNLLPPLRLTIKEKDAEGKMQFINDPLEVTKFYAAPWRKQWNANDSSFAERCGGNFQRLRGKYLEEAATIAKLFNGSAAAIRKALKMFPASTAIGADDFNFRLMAELPDVALDQLGALFKMAIHNLSLPLQVLLNLLCLLGKKTGGSRVIAIMCSFVRVLMKANGSEIREWDREHGHMFDSALADSSSLQAAVLRALKIENGNARSQHCALMA